MSQLNPLKFVVSSDWHGDVITLGLPRFEEVESAVWQSVHHAIRIKAAGYLFLGDLTDPDSGGHTSKTQGLLIEVVHTLAQHDIVSILVAGNHDVHEDGTGATTLTPLAALARSNGAKGMLHVAEQPRLVCFDSELSFLCLPYTPASHGVDIAMMAEKLWPVSGKVVVLSHLTVPGIVPGEETTEMPRGRDVLYPFEQTKKAVARLQGHYHRRQTFDPQDGGPPINIPGSLARLTFGEGDHTPSFLELEI